jgi:hypothetical protein
MEIARLLGWYRVPLRTAPKVSSVDYLAFYQPASFGVRKWRIDFVAPVLGHELTTCLDLLQDEQDHPRADEEYFRLQIGPLIPLPRPIRSGRWKRVTFLYTTGAYLRRANTINDFVVRSEERVVLWRALRVRASRSKGYEAKSLPTLDLDPEVLSAILGVVTL